MRHFGFWLFFFYNLPVTTGQSQLICSSQPIVAQVGDDVILSCRLEPPISASSRTVEWTKPGLDPEYIHVHQDGRLVFQSQNPSYKYRTILFVDQLIHGNVSLKLFSVKVSDAGKYKCFLPSLWKEGFIQLTVASDSASSPVVSLAGLDRGGVVLQCECKGWYPEPEVLWLDGEGNLLSAGPTETVRGPDDLYTVSSRVTVEKRHSNSFTCRVQQNHINQTRDTHFTVPGGFFITAPSGCAVNISISFVIGFILCLAVVFAVWKWRQIKSRSVTNKENDAEKETMPLNKSQAESKNMGFKKTTQESKENVILTSSSDSQDFNSHVIVDEFDLNGKFVRLKNKFSENQILGNWKLKIEVNNTSSIYKFPINFILEAGKMVTIWASDGGGSHKPPTDVVWEKLKSWDTGKPLKITLTSPMGETMDMKTYNPE